MLTALAILLVFETIEAMPAEGLDLVAEIPFGEPFNRSVFSAIPGKGDSESIVFMVSILGERESSLPMTYRYDADLKTLERLQGKPSHGQIDAGLGLAAIEAEDHKSTTVIDVISGRTVSTLNASISRNGVLGIENLSPEKHGQSSRLFDIRTGETLRKYSRSTGSADYIGDPAWDDGKLRLFARHSGSGRATEGMDLVKMRARTFDVEDSVNLFPGALGFDRIIGDPSQSVFAVAYSSNRRVFYKTFTKSLAKTRFQVDHVLGVSDSGVLGRMITKEQEYVDPELGPIGCWNPHTGVQLWKVNDRHADVAIWLKGCALVENEVRDARTGKVIATIPPNRVLIAAKGRVLWTITGGTNQKFEVWRVR